MTPILVLVQSNMTEHLLSVADVVLSIAVEGISTVDHCRHIPSIDRSKLSTKDERVSAQRGFEESTSFIMENESEIEEEIEREARLAMRQEDYLEQYAEVLSHVRLHGFRYQKEKLLSCCCKAYELFNADVPTVTKSVLAFLHP